MKKANSNSPEKNKSNRSQGFTASNAERKAQRGGANNQAPTCNNGICTVTWKPCQA